MSRSVYTPDSSRDCETPFRRAPRNDFPRPVPSRGGLRGREWVRETQPLSRSRRLGEALLVGACALLILGGGYVVVVLALGAL